MSKYFAKTDIDIEKGNNGLHIQDDIKTDNNIMLSSDFKLQNYIIKKIIQPSYISETEDLIRWRYRWRKIAEALQTASEICVITSGILSFLSPALNDQKLALSAGCIAFTSVQLQNWSKKALDKSITSTSEVNELLRALKIEEIPDILDDRDRDNNNDNDNNVSVSAHSTKAP